MSKSVAAYERYLNDYYKNELSIECAIAQLIHTQNKKYSERVAEKKIMWKILAGKGGTILRRHDPIQFHVGYNEWIR